MCRSTAPPSADLPPIKPDTMLGHEIEGAVRAALDRLPAFHRQALGAGHQSVAAIRYLRRNRVELALVRERLSLEGLEDDIDAFLEQFAVLVDQRGAEALYLARMISAGDTEDHPPAAEDVGHRVVFGEAQRVPLNQAAPR
jgi:hypothetical protein